MLLCGLQSSFALVPGSWQATGTSCPLVQHASCLVSEPTLDIVCVAEPEHSASMFSSRPSLRIQLHPPS